MAECKLVINDVKSGKSYPKVLPENIFLGRKVGEKLAGNEIGLEGYELEISGASDNAGFPVRKDLPGVGRKQLILTQGPGLRLKNAEKGIRVKKTVTSNNIDQNIVQVNLKVLSYGSKNLVEALGIAPKAEAQVA